MANIIIHPSLHKGIGSIKRCFGRVMMIVSPLYVLHCQDRRYKDLPPVRRPPPEEHFGVWRY